MDIVTDVQASGHHLDSPEKSSSPESHRLMGSSQSANQYTIDAPGIATRQVTSTEVGASNPLQDQTALERSQEAVLPYQGLVTNRESRINLDQAGRSEHQKVLTEFNAKVEHAEVWAWILMYKKIVQKSLTKELKKYVEPLIPTLELIWLARIDRSSSQSSIPYSLMKADTHSQYAQKE
ncbi:hypothetical protein PGTUg99_031136 [Puccinia graminis f. sp. tritici]|uniref:Uncharacterized protein n=1 Tax=Puccinia graminis f. sp. tritici TaxID=56615 RepID=A0A5B0PPD8_PUCGR|nr:hypothetical protein PGTUg99_031136 [Puccinia graminis f. sp. tritici]